MGEQYRKRLEAENNTPRKKLMRIASVPFLILGYIFISLPIIFMFAIMPLLLLVGVSLFLDEAYHILSVPFEFNPEHMQALAVLLFYDCAIGLLAYSCWKDLPEIWSGHVRFFSKGYSYLKKFLTKQV